MECDICGREVEPETLKPVREVLTVDDSRPTRVSVLEVLSDKEEAVCEDCYGEAYDPERRFRLQHECPVCWALPEGLAPDGDPVCECATREPVIQPKSLVGRVLPAFGVRRPETVTITRMWIEEGWLSQDGPTICFGLKWATKDPVLNDGETVGSLAPGSLGWQILEQAEGDTWRERLATGNVMLPPPGEESG